MTDFDAILKTVVWTEPKTIHTKAGLRTVSNAQVPSELMPVIHDRQFQRDHKFTVSQFRGEWKMTRWGIPTQEVVDGINARIQSSMATSADIEIPAPVGLEFLPFQKAGVKFLLDESRGYKNALLADDMGLGKTPQTVGVINRCLEIKQVLVICPAGLKVNWKNELNKWLVREFTIGIAIGGDFPSDPIVIINYEIVAKHREQIDKRQWDLLVVDEAHNLKNRSAKRTKAVFGWVPTANEVKKVMGALMGDGVDREQAREHIATLSQPPIAADRVFLLTGTPISNRPKELFPLISFLAPAKYKNFFSYAAKYCDAHEKSVGRGITAWDFDGASNLEQLQIELRSTIMLRRLKKDVLPELPPKRRMVLELDGSSARNVIARGQEAFSRWESVRNQLDALKAQAEASVDPNVFAKQIRELGESANADFVQLSEIRLETALAKIPLVIDRLTSLTVDDPEYKVVVFAHHREVLDRLHEAFKEKSVLVVGGMPDGAADAQVRLFQSNPEKQIFFGQDDAASVGHTLTAAAHVIFVEEHWVPGIITQAEDRCVRIGQKFSVLVEHLVFANSIDVKMAQDGIKKQEVIDRAMDNPGFVQAAVRRIPPHLAVTPSTPPEALAIPTEKIALIHQALQIIAGACDGARANDRQGFSSVDSYIGKALAMTQSLTQAQAKLGLRLARKYRRQVPQDIIEPLELAG